MGGDADAALGVHGSDGFARRAERCHWLLDEERQHVTVGGGDLHPRDDLAAQVALKGEVARPQTCI